jgi:hypothetical protein
MALFAIVEPGVVKGVIRPGGGVMALGALIPIVVPRGFLCMAIGTVWIVGVVKIVITPVIGVVTAAAFIAIMVWRRIIRMAFYTIVYTEI